MGLVLAGRVGTETMQSSALATLENKGESSTSGILLLQLPQH